MGKGRERRGREERGEVRGGVFAPNMFRRHRQIGDRQNCDDKGERSDRELTMYELKLLNLN